ncbi:very short patch repair endonuclease [Paraburkholderia agricolaris]|uniref:Very short patch repair endonuclease n=2 Tax=Paraburkholderia agricolaris TaxID=2152888 RepID=A0ABW8ZSM0_9BURK
MTRSENMRRIRSKDTAPEICVRQALRLLGHTGYRLHRRDVPGTPDIAFVGRQVAIMVNGCFWHGHDCNVGRRRPKTNSHYWNPKIARTQQRDRESISTLRSAGWRVLVIWECETRNSSALEQRLETFLDSCAYETRPQENENTGR